MGLPTVLKTVGPIYSTSVMQLDLGMRELCVSTLFRLCAVQVFQLQPSNTSISELKGSATLWMASTLDAINEPDITLPDLSREYLLSYGWSDDHRSRARSRK